MVKVRIDDIAAGNRIRDRAFVVQQKTKLPVQFEPVEPARKTLLAWLERRGGSLNDFEGSVEPQLTTLAALQAKGLIRHIGLSNATHTQVEQARGLVEIVCVQNQYNLAHRDDDAMIDALAPDGIAYVPFFPSAASARSSRRRCPTWPQN